MTMRSIIRILPRNARVEAERLVFDGRDIRDQTERSLAALRGKDISMIFQDPMTSLNPLKRVGDHITEVLRRHGGMGAPQARKEAAALLERVGIPASSEPLGRYPHELSGGMRQRVLIAMALACRPKLLIADEPTTALDVTIQAQILALIRALQEKDRMTVVLITHDLGVVASLCHRVAVMYAGLLMEVGPVDEIFARPLHPYTQALLRSIPGIHRDRDKQSRLLAIEGQPPSMLRPPPGCPFAPRCARAVPECANALPPMHAYPSGHTSDHTDHEAVDHEVRCFFAGDQERGEA
jgi:oligopeptide/dipeptide ABC transporter ATP-binding protein